MTQTTLATISVCIVAWLYLATATILIERIECAVGSLSCVETQK